MCQGNDYPQRRKLGTAVWVCKRQELRVERKQRRRQVYMSETGYPRLHDGVNHVLPC
jgi:hypothetical protein